MSNFTGRRGPNVSQYLAELNTMPSQQDVPAESQGVSLDEFNLFTNTNFFEEFDDMHPDMSDLSQPVEYDPIQEERTRRQNASAAYRFSPVKPEPLNAAPSAEFQYAGYPNFQQVMGDQSAANFAQQGGPYHIPPQSSPTLSSPTGSITLHSLAARNPDVGAKHQHPQAVEEQARVAAEEDKRRRNTAASARFRVKKKQREQALEKQAKEMTDKVSELQLKVSQLEMENKWLRGLVTEKNNGATSGDVTDMIKKFSKEAGAESRSTGEHTDGVGTEEPARAEKA